MKLCNILKGVKCRIFGNSLLEVDGLYHNDKDVKENGLFFCIKGSKDDGEKYTKSAIENGAVAIVVSRELKINITQIIVKDVRKTMSLMACNFYGNPSKELKMIGVTGTNGKTTTTYMIANLLKGIGKKSAIIGTNGVIFNGKIIETEMTTPDPIELQKILRRLVKGKIEYVCMEVSAHAIILNKLEGIKFEVMIFSNLTEDHLDYFKKMENYFDAKKKIFNQKYTKAALINIDDYYGKILFESIKCDKFSYAKNSEADYKIENIKQEKYMQNYNLNGYNIKTNFLGEFNIYNLTSAVACINLLSLGEIYEIKKYVFSLPFVPGRFNTVNVSNRLFVVDYAHTPDGLENVLKLCNNIKDDGRLISVFGCGGNRETQKRSKMGEISTKFADFTIISTDNPRFENRNDIAKEIEKGVINNNYKIILDRSEAIKMAYKFSKEGDVILVAGKGVENYIEENGIKTPYSDYAEIEKLRGEK